MGAASRQGRGDGPSNRFLCLTALATLLLGARLCGAYLLGPTGLTSVRGLGRRALGAQASAWRGRRRVPVPKTTLSAGTTGAELAQSQMAGPKRPLAASVVSWLASKLIRRSTRAVVGLDVDVGARSNADVIMGNLPKVKAKFDAVVLNALQITGGGDMEITGLDFRVFPLLVARRLNVLRRPFEISGRYVLTQKDVQESKLIRDLIQLLVNNVLKALFPSLHLTFFDVSVDAVNITGPKLAIHGTANIAESENGVSFVLLTGVGLAGEGHILYLDQPELVLNPESKLPVKVPLGSIRAFDVDIGDNARIERLVIDEKTGVSITARTLITPAPPFQVSDVGKRAAFLYDLGAFLSSWWGFTHITDLTNESMDLLSQ